MAYRTRNAPTSDAPRFESFWLSQYPFYWLPIVALVLAVFGGFILTLRRDVTVKCVRENGNPECRFTETDYRQRPTRSFRLVTSVGSRPRALPANDDGHRALQVFTHDGPSYSLLIDIPNGRAPELAAGIERFAEGQSESYAFESQATGTDYFAYGIFGMILLIGLGFPRGTQLRVEWPSGILTVRTRFPLFATTRREFELLALKDLSAESISESILERLSASYLNETTTLGSGPPEKVRAAIRFLRTQQTQLLESRRRSDAG